MTEFAQFLTSPMATAVFWFALAAILIAVGVYVIGKVRSGYRGNELQSGLREPPASKWLTNFQEMHEQGTLDDEEFRSIKSKLSARLQQEWSDSKRPPG